MPLLDTTLSKDLLGTFIADLVLQVLVLCRRKRAGKHPAAAARRYRSRPGARRAFWQTLCRDQSRRLQHAILRYKQKKLPLQAGAYAKRAEPGHLLPDHESNGALTFQKVHFLVSAPTTYSFYIVFRTFEHLYPIISKTKKQYILIKDIDVRTCEKMLLSNILSNSLTKKCTFW